MSRGNNKQRIYLTDRDRWAFLVLLDRVAQRYDWQILAYCLMRNHYHLVLRVLDDTLARGMRDLNGVYALYFNSEHGRINHLFGKRYWNEPLTSDAHLKNAIRYVLQNPRRAGVAGPLESHRWTSYAASVGLEFGLSRFVRDELLGVFGPTPGIALPAFTEFCEIPAPPRHVPERLVGYQAPREKLRVRVT